jgi:hypothetical protein
MINKDRAMDEGREWFKQSSREIKVQRGTSVKPEQDTTKRAAETM